MKLRQRFIPITLVVLIVGAIVGLIMTRPEGDGAGSGRRRSNNSVVDQRALQTARNLSALATTREEFRYARQAVRIADHAVDLAFSIAFRENSAQPTDPKTREVLARVSKLQDQVRVDQAKVEDLKKNLASAGVMEQDTFQQELNLMQAQLELDQDELEDAQNEVRRAGNNSGRLQRLFERHQADEQHQNEQAQQQQGNQFKSDAQYGAGSFTRQFSTWRQLSEKQDQLQQAHDDAAQTAESLSAQLNTLRQKVAAEEGAKQQVAQAASALRTPGSTSSPAARNTAAAIASLRQLSVDQKNLSDKDKQIRDHQELSDTYSSWMGVVQNQKQSAIHGMFRSALLIILIALMVYEAGLLINRLFGEITHERKRLQTLRVVARFFVQAVGVLLIVFVLVGTPAQMPTILGLAGAGLTVVLKDFIVAFFGWFVLMGKNGIHIGDWVEINGVVGEVAEINLMRTILLETGNWTDAGHPTGRKVAFMNGYAIEGHFFNFSTSGQWLWDEIQLTVPASEDPYPIIESIQQLVNAETESNSKTAEQEWTRATSQYRVEPVSLAPAINLRPTGSGVEVHIRYITRAHERFATRTKLYTQLVDLLRKKQLTEAVRTLKSNA
jgi:small-conductance mechanosensitive channel